MARAARQVVTVRRSVRNAARPQPKTATPAPAAAPAVSCEPHRPVTRSISYCIEGPELPRPTKRRRTTSYSAENSSRRADLNGRKPHTEDTFPILQLPEDLLHEVVQQMWKMSERATKHSMRMVCHKFCDLTSALASRLSLPLHAFAEFVDNKTRRSPFMLRLPSTFPNVHALTLENSMPDFMKPPVSTSRCRQAARLFLSKVVCAMPNLRELDLKNWPGRRLSQADVQLLVRACPGLHQLKLMTYDDKNTLSTLSQLSSLQNLYIVRSPDQDEDMGALAGFSHLTSLHLGFITDEQNIIASMTQLTSLVSFAVDILLLRDQAAVSMAHLRSLTRLQLGILSPDEAGVDFSNSLRALTNLEDVGLRQYTGCCNTHVIEALGSLPKLRSLQLNPSQFVQCKRKSNPFRLLTRLELQRATVDAQTLEGMGLRSALPQLQHLIFQTCKILHAHNVLGVISKQVRLKCLTIHEVDDVVSKPALLQLTHLKGLQQLYLVSKHKAQLPDAGAQAALLEKMPQLLASNAYKFSFSTNEIEHAPFSD